MVNSYKSYEQVVNATGQRKNRRVEDVVTGICVDLRLVTGGKGIVEALKQAVTKLRALAVSGERAYLLPAEE